MPNELELRIVVKDDGSVVIKRFGEEAGDAFDDTEKKAKSLQSAVDTLARAGGAALVGFAAGLTAIGVGAVSTASEFESAFTGVQKTVEATEAEFASLRTGLEDLSKEIPVAATELFGIAEAAGQLGIATDDILEFTDVMAKLGVTTNLSADEAATALARFRNITGATETSFGQLGSAIVALGNNLATTEAEITEFGLRLAGAGTVIGLSEDQILAMGGALSSLGIQAEAGGSAFQKLFIDLGNAVASGGESLEKFAKVAGLASEEFVTLFEQDAAGAIEALLQGLNDIDAQGGNVFGTLEDLGLSGIRVQRAMLAASQGVDTFSDALDIAEKGIADTSALTKEAELRFQTFESQSQLLSNAVALLFSEIGQQLIPVLTQLIQIAIPIVEAFTGIVQSFEALPGPVKTAAVVIAGVGIAMTGLVGTIGVFLPQIRNVVSAFKLVQGAGAVEALSKIGLSANVSTIAVKGLSLAMKGLAVGGALAVGVAIGTLINKFIIGEQRLAEFSETLGFIPPALDATDASMQALTGNADNVATKLEFLNTVNDRFRESTGGVVTSIREGIAAGDDYDTIISALTKQMQEGGVEGDLLQSIMQQVSTEMSAAANAADDAGENLDNLGDDVETLAEKVQKAVDALGLITVKGAVDEIGQLQLVIDQGAAPTDALVAKVLELTEKYGDLAGQSEVVQAALDGITGSVDQEVLALAKLDAAISALGIVTADQAITKIQQLGLVIEQGAGPPNVLAAAVLALEQEYLELAAVSPEVQAALDEVRASMDEEAIAAIELQTAIQNLGLVSLGDLEMELNDITAAFEAGAGSPQQLEDALDSLEKQAEELGFSELTQDIERLRAEMEASAEAAGRVVDPFEQFAEVIDALGVTTVPKALKSLKDIPAAIQANVIPTSELDRVVMELDEQYGELAKTSPEVAAALEMVTEAARNQGAELTKDKGIFERFTDSLTEGVKGLADPSNIQGFLGSALSGDFKGLASQLADQIGGAIGSAFGPIGTIIGQNISKIAGAIKGLFGKPEFKKVAQDVGRDLGVNISDELAKTIAETSKQTGNRVGAIVANLPKIIEEAGVDSEQALSKFVGQARINLSELDRGLLSSEQAFGQLGESLSLLIPKIGELGAGTQTVEQVFEVLDAALGQVRTGLADTADGAKLLQETFPLLVKEMDSFGAQGVAALRGIIEQSRELGLEVQAITDFVVAKTGEIVQGVDNILGSLRTRIDQLPEDLNFAKTFREAQKQFKTAGTDAGGALVDGVVTATTDPKLRAAVLGIGTQARFAAGAIATVFSELLAQGVPVTEIVQSVQGQITELGDIFAELGIKAPESFTKISNFARKLAREDVAPVIEGIQGMGQALDGLRGLGLLTQQDFSDFSTSLVSGFDQLTMSGLSSREAFAALGPQLQSLVDLQQEFGFEVDAGTQSLIDQAVAQGAVKTASLDTTDSIQAGFQGLFDRFDAFLERQGVATEGMFQFGEQARTAMGVVDGAVSSSADNFETAFGTASTSASAAVNAFGGEASSTYQSITGEAEASAEAQTEAFSSSFQAIEQDAQTLQVNSTAQFDVMKQDAVESAATVEATFATGFQAIEGAVGDLGGAASSAFGGIEDAAGDAVDGALARFRDMEKELVGASIIPDMVNAANAEILTIGDAAGEAASAVTTSFGTEAKATFQALQNEIEAVRMKLATGIEGEDRARLDDRLDDLIARQRGLAREDGGGFRVNGDADRERRRRQRDISMDTRGDDVRRFRGRRSSTDGGSSTVNLTVNVSPEVLQDRRVLEQLSQELANLVKARNTDETRFRGVRRRQQ